MHKSGGDGMIFSLVPRYPMQRGVRWTGDNTAEIRMVIHEYISVQAAVYKWGNLLEIQLDLDEACDCENIVNPWYMMRKGDWLIWDHRGVEILTDKQLAAHYVRRP